MTSHADFKARVWYLLMIDFNKRHTKILIVYIYNGTTPTHF